MTEKEIQRHIWEQRENFADLLNEAHIPKKISHPNSWAYTPSELIYNSYIDKITDLWEAIQGLYFFGYEVPLKKDSDSTIRADFLGTLDGRNGVAVIELKKSAQTERQAFTELLAYGGHIRSVFTPMSRKDIAYILISPMKERIVREATVQSLIYDRNEIFALIPSWQNDDISTLKLTPWIPTFEEISSFTNSTFSESNIEVFKVAWDGLPGSWSPEKKGENPDKYMIEKMNKLGSFAAQIMESRGIHGFVFTSQTWSELRDVGHLINSIVIGGINPYKATKCRVLIEDYNMPEDEAIEVDMNSINMLHIIPELASFAEKENEENNYLSDLSMTWSDEITGIGFDVVRILTKSTSRDHVHTSWGGFSWQQYQESMMEDVFCHNFDIRTTGILRELFFDYSVKDYDFIRNNGEEEHPYANSYGIQEEFIDVSTSQSFVRDFLRRLFDPNYQYDI